MLVYSAAPQYMQSSSKESRNCPGPPGPIELAALRIKGSVSQLVTQDLSEAFPENYIYARGGYDRVFIVAKGYGDQHGGFFKTGYLITLDPDGRFRAGNVRQDVGDYASSWKFKEAKLTAASDMEVIKYGPLLVASLFNQIEEELKKEEDPDKIRKWTQVLQKRSSETFAVLMEARHVLKEIGMDYSELISAENQDYGSAMAAALNEIIKKRGLGQDN